MRVGWGGRWELKFQGSENLTDTVPHRKGSKYMAGINCKPFLNLKIINKQTNIHTYQQRGGGCANIFLVGPKLTLAGVSSVLCTLGKPVSKVKLYPSFFVSTGPLILNILPTLFDDLAGLQSTVTWLVHCTKA